MVWTIELESLVGITNHDLGDIAEDLLARLEMSPRLMGAITYAQLEDRVIGARFDLEASDVEDALRIAGTVFSDALYQAGHRSTRIYRAEVMEELASATPA